MISSCILIGEGSLLIQCAIQLLAGHIKIQFIVSSAKPIQDWAVKHKIPILHSISELKNKNNIQTDYIFSIVNSTYLCSEIIQLASKAVINYHDSLLPSYAGLNATTWALVNDETVHGITWHLVNEHLDQGDIILQVQFAISKTDTAVSLNLRCFQLAVNSFAKLLKILAQSKWTHYAQLLQNQVYFSKTHLLPNLGFINWNTMDSTLIERLHRALTFEQYSNPIGTLKINCAQNTLSVRRVRILKKISDPIAPGTILKESKDKLQISTCDNTVLQIQLYPSLEQAHGISIKNKKLASKSYNSDLQTIHYYRKALSQETYWVQQFEIMTEHQCFASAALDKSTIWNPISPQSKNPLKINFNKISLCSSLLIYFFRLNNYENTSLFILDGQLEHAQQSLPQFFTWAKLLNFSIDANANGNQLYDFVENQLQWLRQKTGHLGDVPHRYPTLKNFSQPRIIISFNRIAFESLEENALIYIQIDLSKRRLHFFHRIAANQLHLIHLVTNFYEHLNAIQQQLHHNPLQAIHQITLISKLEFKQLLTMGAGEKHPISRLSLIFQFYNQVLDDPEKRAITCENFTLSYQDLWDLSDKIAGYISQNTEAQSFIGIYLNRSPMLIAVIWGIIKANCVYIPLDTQFPTKQLQQIVNDADIKWIFTQSEYIPYLPDTLEALNINFVALEKIRDCNFKYPHSVKQNFDESLIYIMYTSGTTGVPKGVMVTEKNVINYCEWFVNNTALNSSSIIDFSSSFAFDLSIPCIIAPFLVGATLSICSEKTKLQPQNFLSYLAKQQISHTELTPGYLKLLLQHPESIKLLYQLQYLLLGAEVLSQKDAAAWQKLAPRTKIINEYGPTETTVAVSAYLFNPEHYPKEHFTPIGKPAFNSSVFVLDKYLQLCPFGMAGELFITGPQLAMGYLKRTSLNQEKFVQLPSCLKPDTRAYRTGDVVYWLPEGNLQFKGRCDAQIKLHGYRIELNAIENVIASFKDNLQVAVLEEKQILVAYLVHSEPINLNTLKTYLSKQLPFYSIPSAYYQIPEIPFKTTEKIDYERLKQLDIAPLKSINRSIQNVTSLEKIGMNIWQEIFNRPVELEEDFFDLGGDSLKALSIVSSLQKKLKISIPLSTLFESPTIKQLAKSLENLIKINNKSRNRFKENTCVIKLAEGKFPIPLFLIHPLGGTIFCYQHLAQLLSGKFTVYGIQDPNLDRLHFHFESLEEMAYFYIQAIKSNYSGDIWYLAGASYGATVAYEMAYQLEESSIQVEFLGLLDGWASYPNFSINKKIAVKSNNTMSTLHLKKLEKHRKLLLNNYSLPSLKQLTTLFKAKTIWSNFQSLTDPANGWEPYLKSLEIIEIGGDHESILKPPNVQQIAEFINSHSQKFISR